MQETPAIQHMPWVSRNKNDHFFQTPPLLINASPDLVWKIATDINNYYKLSSGIITAHIMEGELKVNNTITFKLYENTLLGILIPLSVEKISLVDEKNNAFGWERQLPLHSGMTERYQVLEPREGGKKTASFIALKIPSWIGFLTYVTLKKSIEYAFFKLNEGIKKAAENQLY
jgi:hypothetical protein